MCAQGGKGPPSREAQPREAAGAEIPTATVDGAAADALEPPLLRGALVGRYVVLEVVGSGGMGRIFAAYDPELDRRVALKLLHPRAGGRPAERLVAEAKALARLSHPNVLTVYDAGRWAGGVFLATELIDGVSLARWLVGEERGRSAVVKVFLAAGRGLAAAHEAGLVHRDFKPANVMVGADGRVRVVDFGLALVGAEAAEAESEGGVLAVDELAGVATGRPAAAERLTAPGARAGTPTYMAPEQRAGLEASASSDQYAFAVALFEALTGALPSTDDNGRSLPVWLRRPLERALANDPQERFETMADLLAALERDPARSRRRWLAAAGGLGLVAASAVTLERLEPDVEALCSSGAETMAQDWSPERRDALQAALGDGGGAGAAAAVAATVAAIDRYAQEWTEQYQSACQATHGLGVQSPALLDLRVDCLDQRRRELSALVDAMTNRADLSPTRAVEAASTLTPLARCADTRALQAPVAPPASEQVAVQVADLRERLAEVSALERVGDYDRGAEAAGELVTAARALGYWPLTAEALLALGRIEEQASDDAVSDTLARAVDAAVAGGHARVAAEALVRLVRVHAYQRADLEQGRYHGELASAALERLSAPAELEAELADHLGRLAYQEGDLERAQTLHRRAFALRSELDSTSPEMASSALRLAAIEAERGELAEAIRLAEAAVVVYRSAYGEGHPRLAIALANLGNFHYREGHLEEALERTREALFIQSRTLGDDNPRTADSRLQEATILLALGRPDEALARFEHVRSVYERTYGKEHVRTANVLAYIAGVHDARAEHGVAAELFAQALSVQERAYGPDHLWVANTRYNLAVSLKKAGRFGAARTAFERTLRVLESQVDDGHVLVPAALTGLGQTLVAAGEPHAAVVHLERALAIREARDADPSLLASTRFALARALVAAGDDGPRAGRLAEQAEERYRAVGASEGAAEVAAWRQRPRRD